MIDPVELQRIAVAALSAGGIVLFGAAYAICLALGRLKGLAILRPLSYLAYLALVAVTVAPRAIWRLSVATHESSESDAGKGGANE